MNEFTVTCPCGKSHSISATLAGTELSCDCGNWIPVPRLGELRRAANLSGYPESTAEIIERLTSQGELPAGQNCVVCGLVTEQKLDVVAECETVAAAGDKMPNWALYLRMLLAPVTSLYFLLGNEDADCTRGHEVVIKLPLRMCVNCQPTKPWVWLYTLAATVCFIGGIVVSLKFLAAGLALLAISVVIFFLRPDPYVARAKRLRPIILATPIYRELLEEYPQAKLFTVD